MEFKYPLMVLFSCISSCFSVSVANNCTAMPSNVTLVSCGQPNTSQDECLNFGCCWNSSLDANATKCYGIANNQSNVNSTYTTSVPMTTANSPSIKVVPSAAGPKGTCQVYRGEVCDRWLNYTMLEYRMSPRFIDNRFGLNQTEKMILEFMRIIERIKGQVRCKEILKSLLCEYFLPPCNEKNEPYSYCREDCEAVFETCNVAMRELLGAAKYIVDELGVHFAHVEVPDCTKHRYAADFKARNSTCVHFGLFAFDTPMPVKKTGPETSSKSKMATIIAGAVGGLVTLVVIILIISCVTKRRGKKPLKLNKGAKSCGRDTSIRNRIQAEVKRRAPNEDKVTSLFKPDDIREIPLTRMEYIRDLGSWNFGLVFLGRAYGLMKGKDDAGLMVAVKTLNKGSSTETKEYFIEKLALMSLLHHENIVELLAVSTEEEPYGMIFEYMQLGDLAQYLRRAGPFHEGDEREKVTLTQDDLMSISLQCAAGMEHLQKLKFVHSDVSTRNCLVGTGLIVKIADFGMSRDIYVSDYHKVEGRGLLPIRWMAPEALFLGKFTLGSDVYSFGVLLWEIYTMALQPYYGYTNEEVVEFIKEGVHLGQTDYCPDHLYQIMKSCWNQEASQRPNFTLIIAQLKQEVTSHYESFYYSQPITDEEPLYQRISGRLEELREEVPATRRATVEISQQASGTPQPVPVHQRGPAYVNVALKLSFQI